MPLLTHISLLSFMPLLTLISLLIFMLLLTPISLLSFMLLLTLMLSLMPHKNHTIKLIHMDKYGVESQIQNIGSVVNESALQPESCSNAD